VGVGLRSASLAVSCAPASVAAGQQATCSATVTDTAGGTAQTPAGTVSFSAPGGGLLGAGGSCLLSGSGATASCAVLYTAGSGSAQIQASYAGDGTHSGDQAQIALVVSTPKHPALVTVTCSPGTVLIGARTTCNATVTGSAGSAGSATGTIAFATSGGGGVTGGGPCTLTSGECAVAYTVGPSALGTDTVTAAYSGDLRYDAGSGLTSFAPAPVGQKTATITVVSGTVLIRLPHTHQFIPALAGTHAQPATLAPIKGSTLTLPLGTTVDTTRGTVSLASASTGQARVAPGYGLSTGTFSAGIFAIQQQLADHARHRRRALRRRLITRLQLRTPVGAIVRAGCQRSHPSRRAIVRSLNANTHGAYNVIAYASTTTTTTGGIFDVRDYCRGTFTEVGRGRATVIPTTHAHPHQHPITLGPGQGVIIKGVFR
jgi:hypothetical protein